MCLHLATTMGCAYVGDHVQRHRMGANRQAAHSPRKAAYPEMGILKLGYQQALLTAPVALQQWR